MNRKIWQTQNGFSMIELLIVVLVVSIVAVASLPQIERSLDMYRVRTGVRMLTAGLLDTKMAAIKWNRACWLEIDPAKSTMRMRSTDASGTAIALGPSRPLPAGLKITGTALVKPTYTSLGRIQPGSSNTIEVKNSKTKGCSVIKISSSGRVSVAKCLDQ